MKHLRCSRQSWIRPMPISGVRFWNWRRCIRVRGTTICLMRYWMLTWEDLPPGEQALYYDLSLVVIRDELSRFQATPDEERKAQSENFWATRDPAPGDGGQRTVD